MFKIDKDKNIYLTRGDIAKILVTAKTVDGYDYTFKKGDVIRFNIFKKAECHSLVLKKDVVIDKDTSIAEIYLKSEETKIGELISKPTIYWYEVVLNPETAPQTIIGYLEMPTIFKLLPEGGDAE